MQKYLLFLCIGLLCACNSNRQSAPSNLIEADKMQLVLQDIHYADGLANREGEADNSTESRTKALYKGVFAKHGISEQQFFESFNYYLQHAAILDSIYKNMIVEISKQQAAIQAEK
ncbi:MAG: DUF4296 domain-containing protein [Chitinophagales bacterium]|nr:DUF4296 domain-containing protein [Chitinophagales bacterium]